MLACTYCDPSCFGHVSYLKYSFTFKIKFKVHLNIGIPDVSDGQDHSYWHICKILISRGINQYVILTALTNLCVNAITECKAEWESSSQRRSRRQERIWQECLPSSRRRGGGERRERTWGRISRKAENPLRKRIQYVYHCSFLHLF